MRTSSHPEGDAVFLAPAQFDFIAGLRSIWRDIRAECLALPQESFEPWVQREMYEQSWSVYGLIEPFRATVGRCV